MIKEIVADLRKRLPPELLKGALTGVLQGDETEVNKGIHARFGDNHQTLAGLIENTSVGTFGA